MSNFKCQKTLSPQPSPTEGERSVSSPKERGLLYPSSPFMGEDKGGGVLLIEKFGFV